MRTTQVWPPPGLTSPGQAARTRLAPRAAAAVLVDVLAASLTWWHTADDRQLAAHYRQALAVADGRYLTAGGMTAASRQRAGHVFAYQARRPGCSSNWPQPERRGVTRST